MTYNRPTVGAHSTGKAEMPRATKYSNPVSVRLPSAMLARLDEAARQQRVPRSVLVIKALDAFLVDYRREDRLEREDRT